ncbi:peptidoglycan editing factor PgeF [Candidatus Contubernalis alkaliaceticus]|uniref:peptidoglycan editing factor PgeF n=1 Tax=Candidatus Contubernalis alkaliaceticus TaxID=338645 RepID=UPI001F4C034A|nr:peptidoglycan editing factor PgeF [Candidatus Contubernalis alkalaceticus]UNC92851.1 peptidoglycan editing factor PgeF [Candidatus Contubernalis alkalaceticus]
MTIPSFTKRGIIHGFSTRKLEKSKNPSNRLDNECGQRGDEFKVYENRQTFFNVLNLKGDFWSLKQIHGSKVITVGKKREAFLNKEGVLEGDGLVTGQRGVILTMYSADCVIIFLFDPVKQVIGLGHAGWRGTVRGIGSELVKTMVNSFGSNAGDILVGIGPAIGACCYEVGFEVIKKVSEAVKESHLFVKLIGEEKWILDLKMLNVGILETAGVRKDNITISSHCTFCHPDSFFSFRRDGGKTGRMVSVISLS